MINKKQVDALKYLILRSKDASELTKKILFFLLEQSNLLRKAVYTSVVETKDGFSKENAIETYNGVHDMKSSQAFTHLNEIMVAMGSDFLFYVHAGAYQADGEFKEYEKILSYTVWLSDKRYDGTAKRIDIKKDTLDEMVLVSDLYEKVPS